MLNRMFRVFTCGVVSLGLLAAVGLAQDPPTIREREKNQQKRIKEGAKSGQLTKKEAVKLERKEAKMHREIRRDRKDGPGLTPKERAKIDAKQDKLSREIYKQKHDKQTR